MYEHEPIPVTETEVGEITHYWSHLGVAGVHLTAPVDTGDHIHVLGHTSDFEQDIGSMEVEHHKIQHGEPGEDVGLRVVEHVREHDRIYRVAPVSSAGAGQHEL